MDEVACLCQEAHRALKLKQTLIAVNDEGLDDGRKLAKEYTVAWCEEGWADL